MLRSCIVTFCILSMFVLVACSDKTSTSEKTASADVPESASVSRNAARDGRLAAALSKSDRSENDKQSDAGRKPDEIIRFWGVESGMTALDMFSASGYYAEMLSAAVGPDGKVYAHNIDFLLTVRDGVNAKHMETRLTDDRLPNVEHLVVEVRDMSLEPESVDIIAFVQNYHDVYAFSQEAGTTTSDILQGFYGVLRPGGILGVVDHVANPGDFDRDLHRIDPEIVRREVTNAGFVLEAENEVLHNPEDDHTLAVFDASVRGKTDRFVIRFRKPVEGE